MKASGLFHAKTQRANLVERFCGLLPFVFVMYKRISPLCVYSSYHLVFLSVGLKKLLRTTKNLFSLLVASPFRRMAIQKSLDFIPGPDEIFSNEVSYLI